jgi:RimJ/RimL family protein N-acetyltransferase
MCGNMRCQSCAGVLAQATRSSACEFQLSGRGMDPIIPTMRVFLETERLILRLFTEADAGNLVRLDSDPQVMRYLTGGKPTPPEVIQNEVLPAILNGSAGRWAAVERSTGEFLGWFSLRPCAPGEVELGYRLVARSWGKGYATEGARALVHKGFTELGARRVFAQTMAVNLASRRVMEKAGLNHVRTFHLEWEDPIAGAEHGEVEYELWGGAVAVTEFG